MTRRGIARLRVNREDLTVTTRSWRDDGGVWHESFDGLLLSDDEDDRGQVGGADLVAENEAPVYQRRRAGWRDPILRLDGLFRDREARR